jgi:hypothetical protein
LTNELIDDIFLERDKVGSPYTYLLRMDVEGIHVTINGPRRQGPFEYLDQSDLVWYGLNFPACEGLSIALITLTDLGDGLQGTICGRVSEYIVLSRELRVVVMNRNGTKERIGHVSGPYEPKDRILQLLFCVERCQIVLG